MVDSGMPAPLMGNTFSEERVNAAFRRVRNRLRKHYPIEIVSACIKKLNEEPNDRIQHLRNYPTWRLLLLIKWTLIYGDYLAPGRKILTVNSFNYLLNLMNDFEGTLRHPGEYENIFLFFRNMAFQQFWLQHEFNMATYSRQNMLFSRLDDSHPFKKRFSDKCGISMREFIELAMMMMTRFTIEKMNHVTLEWFRNVANQYEMGTMKKFLDLLSVDLDVLRAKLAREKQDNRKVSYEAYEMSPLRDTPILYHTPRYYPFSKELLGRCLEHFIYDSLRSENHNEFMDKFGPIFESYVGYCITKTNIKFYSEQKLAQIIPGVGKLVDYLMVNKDDRVFIDAKGVEMAYLGMVGHQPEIITDKTRTSIVKGIQQGLETASRLSSLGQLDGVDLSSGKNYLLVVTYKSMYVGNGMDFYQYVAKGLLDRIVTQEGYKLTIPFERMYFLSIEEFELLTGGISSGEIELSELLDHAVKSDSLPQSKKFEFSQHIFDKYHQSKVPAWLKDEAEYLLECCRARFENGRN